VVLCHAYCLQDLPPQQILLGLMCGNLHLDIPEWCEPEWRFLLEACMEPNPNNRPTMRELARQLEAIRDQQLQHEQELEELEAKQQQPQAQEQAAAAAAAQPVLQQQDLQQQPVGQETVPVPAAPVPTVLLQQLQQNQAGQLLQSPQQLQRSHSQQQPPLHVAQQRPVQDLQLPAPQPQLSPVQLPDDLLDEEGAAGAGVYGAVCEHYWPQQSPLAAIAVASPGHVGPIGPLHPQLQQL
jgi:hypothetical protein